MMTAVVKSCVSEQYYIEMSTEIRYDNDIYVVRVSPRYKDGMCGYPLREISYPITEKKKANATYNRYRREFGVMKND